ncbi:acyltransferase family protein [Luteimonas qiangzhengi]|uniref:acyltransferase family protein n=1 Tax=Luteimonas sp. MJ146 TaxID=3129240 RepID=UPI0031BAE244
MNVTEGTRTFRPEIQGVRAIAVIAVLIFHLWPSILPGGYVGVDVFFVVSGFLITGLLLRQVERTGRIQVLDFYAKRIKRLLPAATLVLVAVGTCVSLLPILRWADTANEIAASALYVENWWLAAKAVDYLAAEAAPSPLQHFWSLSVEEQYYIAWPLIFSVLGAFGLLQRFGPRRTFGVAVVVIGLASLVYSIYITPKNPGLAYFATTTRAWELALGGALAVFTGWERIPEFVRRLLGIIGLVMVVAAVMAFSGETVFPGYAAALPTVGAALLIVSGDSRSVWSVFSILKSKPFQYIGDLSYSLYLWHWPVVVFYAYIAAREVGLVDGVVIASISLALAHQTKELVEDQFRAPEFASGAWWKPFVFAVMCIALPIICWAAINFQVGRHASYSYTAPERLDVVNYPGALSRTHGIPAPANVPYIPEILRAKHDRGDSYEDGCIAGLTETAVRECRYGSSDAARHVVIVGDSHAVHWIPALQFLANHGDLRVTAFTKSACAVVDLTVEGLERDQHISCLAWSRNVIQQLLALKPDAVIFAHSQYSLASMKKDRQESADAIADSLTYTWRQLDKAGIHVYAIADTPSFSTDVPDCLSGAGGSLESCSRPRVRALPQIDPLKIAAGRFPGVRLLDYSDVLCGPEVCSPVVGNVLVWRDAHHMTATFSRTLAGELSRDLSPLVREISVADFGLEVADNGRHPAVAMATARPCPTVESCLGSFTPSLVAVKGDVPAAYDEGCHVDQRTDEPAACTMGPAGASVRMFVAGDSHAAQWLPAYKLAAEGLGWKIQSFTKSACSFSDLMVRGGVSGQEYVSCRRWGERLLDRIEKERPDYILVSQSVAYQVAGLRREESFEPLVNAYTRYIKKIQGFGVVPIILADTPRLGINVPECLAGVGATFEGCSRKSAPLLARKDPLVAAAVRAGAATVTLNDHICTGEHCKPVVDGILIWRDSHHVTATFAESLGDELAEKLRLAASAL